MIFGALQMLLGVVLLAGGPLLGAPTWVCAALVWPGASVLIVGAAYVAGGPGVFGKREADGAMSPAHVALLLPYVAVAWGLWQLKSRLGREPAFHEVAPGVLVGRRPLTGREMPPDVAVVVDLTSELPRAGATRGDAEYVCLPTLDTAAPAADCLRALVDRLERQPGRVLFHCAMGHGRSATAAAALLIRRGVARDVDDAVAKMVRTRPRIHLHAGQRAAVARLSVAAPAGDGAKTT